MDRRHFFQTSFLTMLSGFLNSSCTSISPRNGSGYSAQSDLVYVGLRLDDHKSILRKLDLNNWQYEDIILPIANPHSVTKDPSNPAQIFVFGFEGPVLKVNLLTGEFKSSDPRQDGPGVFLGHGFIDAENEIIWCTERTSQRELVRARSTRDLKLIDERNLVFPGGHHVTSLPGTHLLVSFGSQASSPFVSYYDYRKRTLAKTINCAFPGVHAVPLSSHEVIAVTTEHEMGQREIELFNRRSNPTQKAKMTANELQFAGFSPLIKSSTDGAIQYIWDEHQRELFQLGLGIDRIEGKLITSHSSSDAVILWKGTVIEKIISVPQPLVIVATSDGKRFVAQSEGKLRIYSLSTGLLVKESNYDRPVLSLAKY